MQKEDKKPEPQKEDKFYSLFSKIVKHNPEKKKTNIKHKTENQDKKINKTENN